MATLPNLEELDRDFKTTFVTTHTTGGKVTNVNGDYIQGQNIYGDYVAQANITINFGSGSTPKLGANVESYTMDSLGLALPPGDCPSFSPMQTATRTALIDTCYTSAIQSIIEVRLMIDIVRSAMMDNPALSSSASLPETLASLQRLLKLMDLALRAYQNTPLVQTLSRTIAVEVDDCRQLLRQMLSNLGNYRHLLAAIVFHFMRRYTWGILGGEDESGVLNAKLRERNGSLAASILALGCIARLELQHHQGVEALEDFYSLLQRETPSLRHINVDTITVVDHLGRKLPVPTMFCDSWKNFHIVITGFCKSVAGEAIIQRGDYRILRENDDQVIKPSHISTVVRSGMTVEMSVVMHREAEVNSGNEHRCPRCRYANSKVITASGWVTCQRCYGSFQITPMGDGIVSSATQDSDGDIVSEESCFFRRISIITPRDTAPRIPIKTGLPSPDGLPQMERFKLREAAQTDAPLVHISLGAYKNWQTTWEENYAGKTETMTAALAAHLTNTPLMESHEDLVRRINEQTNTSHNKVYRDWEAQRSQLACRWKLDVNVPGCLFSGI